MGDRRKLHGEIERCLKKVTEGVETFEDIWQKVHTAPNHNQKDKYEQELKKEIKKLQRLRDQIKAWIASTEIKDKTQLQEARKNIEQQMERFKIVERETKTKAFSNGNLVAGQKLDPQEKEKEECTRWIRDAIQELQIQIDKFEADIETLSVSLKKKKSDRDKQERLEETKRSMERHKFHIESLEKILRAIDNEVIDLKPIQNLRDDLEYYIKSNQDSDFSENDLMYEEIDLDNLTSIMAPVIALPTTTTTIQCHGLSSSLSNGSASNSMNATTLMDIGGLHSHSLINHSSERTGTMSSINSNHGDNESNMGLTTPSSTQPSSPSASPALSLSDDRKRNKSESEDTHHPQRNRTNSGMNGSSSTSTTTYVTSPKNANTQQQSPSVVPKTPLTTTSSLSTSVPPHFTYPTTSTTSTQPVLQYSTIVSQNTAPSTPSTTTTTTSKQQNIISPQTKQIGRQTSVTNNESTPIITNSNQSSSSSSTTTTPSISSHPLPLLNNNTSDRNGVLNQHIFNNISQISGSTSNSSGTITLANGTTIPSSLYSGPGSNLSSSNIPLDTSPPTSLDPTINSQPSPLLSRTISDNDRSTALITNGSLDGHTSSSSTSLDNNTFPNLPTTTASSFLSNNPLNDLPSTSSTTGVIGQLPDHHTLRYLIPPSTSSSSSLNQPTIQTSRVPLTQAETRMLNRLNSAYAKLPSLLEAERQRTNANRFYGRNPLGPSQNIPYYPQTAPAGSDTPEFYYRLAPDTLFFVFYYMEGTRAQYLAAKALKRQSWRFHTKHMMWFQRHEEPKTITDDYEQGTYIFFDYERWQTRKRDNFIFEYKFLEDREF